MSALTLVDDADYEVQGGYGVVSDARCEGSALWLIMHYSSALSTSPEWTMTVISPGLM